MIFGPVFDQFVHQSSLSVMTRATIEHTLSAAALDALFARTAERGYTRELLFSTTVDMLSLVVCGKSPHVQASYQHLHERIPPSSASMKNFQNLETGVSAALVRHVAGRCHELISSLGGSCQPLLPGYRVRIVDGNHLAATQRRLRVTRGHSVGPLPGQSLAVLDPESLLIIDLIPCEDAHTQERALLASVLDLVRAGDVWIEDRNFCTVDFVVGVSERQACFVTRRHSNMTIESPGTFAPEEETATGWVREEQAWVCREDQHVLPVRRVRVRLKQPTQDGERDVEILTNLPAAAADAVMVAHLYLKRWKIERAFHELTMALP